MANRDRRAQYVASEVLKSIIQIKDDSEFEDSDVSSEDGDYISECSDFSDTESLKQSSSDEDEISKRSTRDDDNQPSGGRGLGERESHMQDHGQGGVVQPDASATEQTHTIFVGKNGTMWQKQPPVTARRRTQDIIRQVPGITSAVSCTSTKQAFSSFITEVMIDLVVVNTNREAHCTTNE